MRMKQNKLTLLFAAIVSGAVMCQNAGATLLVTDQFSGYATGNLGASGTGGTGVIPTWVQGSANVAVTNGSHSLDGTGLGLVSSAGDKVTISATSALSTYNQFVASGTFPQTTQTNIYYSFLYRFNVGTDVTNGQVVCQVNKQNSGSSIYQKLVARPAGGGNVQLGVAKPSGTTTNFAATLIAPGQTIFVVLREQIIPGATNDIADLWIDPPAAFFGTNEASVPPTDATTSDGAEDPTSATGPGRFYIGSGASANLDELRIATTWAEVTPPVGQCLVANITLDPTNVAQVAEISAAFSAAAVGTSPTYQWQISKDGGVTFSNIAGAIQPNYTTPNLVLASDNGNKYRMIVTVPCNSSSATSAVATVSLTAPIVTPPSVVMDDTFADGLRDDPPVTPSNSVWRTNPSANLNAVPGSGLVATPVTGSASLFLGYFTDIAESNVPAVDLAVGTSLKVTMPFIPASYTSFTNNGTLRFGIYDYTDGGTPLIADNTLAGGSTGNGVGVRGYMLSVDFGPTFSVSSPLSLLVRSAISDINLMGTTGDYQSMGSGPSGGGFTGMTAFQAGTTYNLVMSVSRTDVNSVDFTTTISGGGTNWTFSSTDTNFAYHRFDSFGIRDASLETTADQFTFPEFKVEVDQNPITVTPFPISIQTAPNALVLTWTSVPTATYNVESTASLSPSAWVTNAVLTASGTSLSYTNTPLSGSSKFFRVVSPQ